MPTVHLHDRALIDIAGEDAESFLQTIITADLATLARGEARAGALLSPQGKILFDFLVSRTDHGLVLECRADIAETFIRRLTLYRLRARVTIAQREQSVVAIGWQNESPGAAGDPVADTRFRTGMMVHRFHDGLPVADAADAAEDAWHALRIAGGVAESGEDYALGDAFPHDVLLDQNGGVGFRKGCYVGQEVVSRMQHRGTARRRVLILDADAPLPAAGTEIVAAGRGIGQMGSSVGRQGLAILRIDRVKEALDAGVPLEAGGVAVSASIPAWAGFTFPEAIAGAEG